MAVEAHFHEATVAAARRFVRGPTVLGGDDGPHGVLVTCELMIRFGIVTRVGCQLRQRHDPERLGDQRAELVDVGPRPPAHPASQDEMVVAVAHDAQLGIVMINHGFPSFRAPAPAANEVAACATAFEARRIDRRALHPSLTTHLPANGGLQ